MKNVKNIFKKSLEHGRVIHYGPSKPLTKWFGSIKNFKLTNFQKKTKIAKISISLRVCVCSTKTYSS